MNSLRFLICTIVMLQFYSYMPLNMTLRKQIIFPQKKHTLVLLLFMPFCISIDFIRGLECRAYFSCKYHVYKDDKSLMRSLVIIYKALRRFHVFYFQLDIVRGKRVYIFLIFIFSTSHPSTMIHFIILVSYLFNFYAIINEYIKLLCCHE